uniref:non-specific serine/threonine protein kinase n=1 Tax=Eptatretus burgeri TaxID=7764 RepID=A0A8C4PYW0_EPTBU
HRAHLSMEGRFDTPASKSLRVNGSRSRSSIACGEELPHIGNYRLLKTIGKGNFAKVKLARHILTGREVSIHFVVPLFREVRIMKMLNHPNIGEVFDFLVAHGRMKEKDARAKFRQILSAVQYCHQKNIVHRDLKAENLLLDADMKIKIADFGFSNEFTLMNKLDTFCGSPPYAAPELFQGKKYDGPEVDVWNGFWTRTVSGGLPIRCKNLRTTGPELREKVLRGKYRIPFYMSTDCENLLKRFLVLNPLKRGSLEQIMKDRWMNVSFEDDLLKPYEEPELDINDTKRIEVMVGMGYTCDEIKNSLEKRAYDDIMATYLLLGAKAEVGVSTWSGSNMSLLKLRSGSDTSQSLGPSPSPSQTRVQRSSAANQKNRRGADGTGLSIPASAYIRRSQTNTADMDRGGDIQPRRWANTGGPGRRSDVPPSPLLNKVTSPTKTPSSGRKKPSAIPIVFVAAGSITRRNTYICERTTNERHTAAVHNGKDLGTNGQRGPGSSPSSHSINNNVSSTGYFSRGVSARNTVHGGQLPDSRGTQYPSPPSPSLSHDHDGLAQGRRGASAIFSKLTSKFSRRQGTLRVDV